MNAFSLLVAAHLSDAIASADPLYSAQHAVKTFSAKNPGAWDMWCEHLPPRAVADALIRTMMQDLAMDVRGTLPGEPEAKAV